LQIELGHTTKQVLFRFLRVRVVNKVLRGLLKPLSPVLPGHLVGRIPVVGRIEVAVPPSRVLLLEGDGNDSLASGLYWKGLQSFEPETVELFLDLLEHAAVVLDIGAYTGLFALLAAVDCPARDVHAFEAAPRNFEALTRNIQVNRLDNVTPVWGAVANHDGEALLHIPRTTTLPFSASTRKGFREANQSIVVPALRIDTYIEAAGTATVGLIKIDTEGTEPEVLEGAETVLERDRPLVICEVLKGQTERRLHAVLEGKGYRTFHITAAGLIAKEEIEGDARYQERNYLFTPEECVSAILQERRPGRWSTRPSR
jgi:FkbM family methyltransferase